MLKIVLAIDGSPHSDRAAAHVIKLHAAHAQIKLALLNVQIPVESGHARMFISKSDLENYYQEEGQQALDSARKLLDQAEIPYTEHIAVGHVAETIANFSREQRCDQIVMGTHGRSALTHLLLGSVASEVTHLSDAAVTLVK